MLSINDLKNGIIIKVQGDPYVVLSVKHLHMGRGGSSVQTKIKNLKTGQALERNFKPADEFEEAEIEKMKSRFLYENRGEWWFDEIGNPKNRFALQAETLGDSAQFLKSNLDVLAIKFSAEGGSASGGDSQIIGIELPIKVDYKVVEAPPAIRGSTAAGGTKTVVIETGAKIQAPLFINEGDVIKVNTQTGEYAERIEKGN
ncbi:elongation factor P [Candidatus Wolfebacteria bacterium]|nr:elongation factor P [Candidatus Wolfebacteria bacterium]